MNSIIQTFKQVGVLTTALTLALVANFAYGQWADPVQAPTGGNIAAPINTGSTLQVKDGALGVDQLSVFGSATVESNSPRIEFSDTDETDWWIHTNSNRMYFINDRNDDGSWAGESPWPMYIDAANDYMSVSGQTRVGEYCDESGNNCFTAQDIADLVDGGSSNSGLYLCPVHVVDSSPSRDGDRCGTTCNGQVQSGSTCVSSYIAGEGTNSGARCDSAGATSCVLQ